MYSNMIENIIRERDKYKNGVLKLNGFAFFSLFFGLECSDQVEKLNIELKDLKPNLDAKSKETDKIMK